MSSWVAFIFGERLIFFQIPLSARNDRVIGTAFLMGFVRQTNSIFFKDGICKSLKCQEGVDQIFRCCSVTFGVSSSGKAEMGNRK